MSISRAILFGSKARAMADSHFRSALGRPALLAVPQLLNFIHSHSLSLSQLSRIAIFVLLPVGFAFAASPPPHDQMPCPHDPKAIQRCTHPDDGDRMSATELGRCHECGWGVRQDLFQAARLYKVACRSSDHVAETYYGYYLEYGRGVAQNYTKAAKYDKRAADEGDASGEFRFGYLIFHGLGVARDLAAATRYLRLAAEKDHADAQAIYGLAIESGVDGPVDHEESFK